jgi:putative endonuclease
LSNRIRQHRSGKGSGYTKGIRPVALVWFERHDGRDSAAARERQLKGWNHSKKAMLVRGELVLSETAQTVWVSLD